MTFTWLLACSGCSRGWWDGPRQIHQVSWKTVFPLRCPSCGVLEGWSAHWGKDLILGVCEKLVEVYGPAVYFEVGPCFDPEGDENSEEEFNVHMYSSKPYEEIRELDEKWWDLDYQFPWRMWVHAEGGAGELQNVSDA